MRTLTDLPGPSHPTLFTNAFEVLRDEPHVVFARWAREHGDFLTWWSLGTPKALANAPDLVEKVLVSDTGHYEKDNPVDELRPIVRSSVFIANEPHWSAKRAAHPLEQGWAAAWLAASVPTIRKHVRETLSTHVAGADLYEHVNRGVFRCFWELLAGIEPPDHSEKDARVLLEVGANRMKRGPITVNARFDLARRRWFETAETVVAAAEDAPAHSLLAKLSSPGSPLSGDALVDEFATIFLAGVGPISMTLTGLAFNLADHRASADALTTTLVGLSDAPTLGELHATAPLAHWLSESLRWLPTVPVVSRVVRAGHSPVLRDVRLRERDEVFISAWALHRSPAVWADPERFDPTRFTTPAPPSAFIPFGAGPRTCVGRHLAWTFALVALEEIARRWTVGIDTSDPFAGHFYTGFMKPRSDVRATLRPR